jgi:hypothetical protein
VLICVYWGLAPLSDEPVGTSWNAMVFVYGDPWSAARGLSMTERPTNRPNRVRTSPVSAPHREGRVASQPVFWAS